MRVSRLFNKTLKEAPADAEVKSHDLLVRAGMIRKLASGIYSYLPLGLRVINKITKIVREEMDEANCQELLLPIIQPAELWQESGRWFVYGDELMRFKDRHQRDYCLSPTHEEVITTIVKNDVKSYKNLPLNLYQIQNKYRDERRPRFGLMRSREFYMKDGYSFDQDEQGMNERYEEMYQAYSNVFTRCGLDFRPVEADSGAIGGSKSHEFMVLAETGECLITYCDSCDYAANVERANHQKRDYITEGVSLPLEKVETKNLKSIEDVSTFLKMSPEQMIKTVVYEAIYKDRTEIICVALRGHREANEIKILNSLGALELKMATDDELKEQSGLAFGFIGPVGLNGFKILVDEEVLSITNGCTGANENDYHLINVDAKRDIKAEIIDDFHNVEEGDLCPVCGGKLKFARGIEVGQVFKLGTKYTESFNCVYLDENGKEQLMHMGCYGIGVSRTLAACVEQNYDDKGIVWPQALAPYQVIVVPVNVKDENILKTAEEIYQELKKVGLEVIIDDTKERAGVKFANSDLIGYPLRITVGKKVCDEGLVDLKIRKTGEEQEVKTEDIVAKVKEILS